MYEQGLLVTLNTDDPAEFDSGFLTNLLIGVQKKSGYSKSDIVGFMQNAFEGSWLSRSAKNDYLKSLLNYATNYGLNIHRN